VIKLDKANEATWRVVPANTPLIVRHCSKCNKKMEFYCSEKFRVNANQVRVDIWLIYKCRKCDSTWKLTINKGIKPRELQAGLFDRFVNNDSDLAWDYAFDRYLLKQNACVVCYDNVEYAVEGPPSRATEEPFEKSLLVHLKSQYFFDLKLSALLAKALGVSIGQVKRLVEHESITVYPKIDIMKYRIKNDVDIILCDIFC